MPELIKCLAMFPSLFMQTGSEKIKRGAAISDLTFTPTSVRKEVIEEAFLRLSAATMITRGNHPISTVMMALGRMF
jgi:hypothetical protein